MRHIRQERAFRLAALLGLYPFLFKALLTLAHLGIDVRNDDKAQRYQAYLDNTRVGEGATDIPDPFGKESIVCPGEFLALFNAVGSELSLVVFAYVGKHFLGARFVGLPYPHKRGEEYDEQKSYPYRNGRSETSLFVLHKNITEEQYADDAPEREQQIRRRFHFAHGEQVRYHQKQAHHARNYQSEQTRYPYHLISRFLRRFKRAGRGVAISYRRADGHDIHHPDGGISAEERYH